VIVEGGYIRVVQDVRGKHGSEGDYVLNRPLRGPQNPTSVDHATDTYDTIDWLVKNVPESNGRVGILGISYNGFLPLMALVNPHPALKVAVPMNPMVDGWMGDDWFHYGAFRQQMVGWLYGQLATRKGGLKSTCPIQPNPSRSVHGPFSSVAADIFRGRYRESFERPRPLEPEAPLAYKFHLPTVNHVFLPGHRIMVQVQSSWFPLYDRNPQTFVTNIFWAKPAQYRKATQRVYHTPDHASFVELPVVP
jgi:predicted acyl esterase